MGRQLDRSLYLRNSLTVVLRDFSFQAQGCLHQGVGRIYSAPQLLLPWVSLVDAAIRPRVGSLYPYGSLSLLYEPNYVVLHTSSPSWIRTSTSLCSSILLWSLFLKKKFLSYSLYFWKIRIETRLRKTFAPIETYDYSYEIIVLPIILSYNPFGSFFIDESYVSLRNPLESLYHRYPEDYDLFHTTQADFSYATLTWMFGLPLGGKIHNE